LWNSVGGGGGEQRWGGELGSDQREAKELLKRKSYINMRRRRHFFSAVLGIKGRPRHRDEKNRVSGDVK
jgi:hypothetical protein